MHRFNTMNAAVHEDIFLPCLRSLEMFKDQDDKLLGFLGRKNEIFEAPKGDLVCKKGMLANGLFCVFEGSVKLAVISHNGNERVVEIVGSGGVFGEASMFLERPCPVYAEALVKTQIVYLRRDIILNAISRYPEFALRLINGMSDRLHRLVRDVEVCCLQPAADRVMSFILDNVKPDGTGFGGALVELPAGKAVVASSLNLTPETFSRELHQLASQNLVEVGRRVIVVKDLVAIKQRLLVQ